MPLRVASFEPRCQTLHAEQRWPTAHDLLLDYCERYAREHADRPQGRAGRSLRLAPGSQGTGPLVTVSVAYYNLAPYLEAALASLAAQSYPAVETLVINDGSTGADANHVFREMQARYPQYRFLSQENAGIGATRNRGLSLAQGKYFLPMDADNVAHPDMVRLFVNAMERNPDLAAATCYFLAFRESSDLAAGRYAYVCKPTGGPRVLGALHNVYGDGNAIFRTDALRAVGGFETDRDTSFEDWEVFVKLTNAGFTIDVVPECLFCYRHRDASFSRVTSDYRNHQRVLRRFVEVEQWAADERHTLWNLLAGTHHRLTQAEDERRTLQRRLASRRYRLSDRLNPMPLVRRSVKWLASLVS